MSEVNVGCRGGCHGDFGINLVFDLERAKGFIGLYGTDEGEQKDSDNAGDGIHDRGDKLFLRAVFLRERATQIKTSSSNNATNCENEERLVTGAFEAVQGVGNDAAGTAVKEQQQTKNRTSHGVPIL